MVFSLCTRSCCPSHVGNELGTREHIANFADILTGLVLLILAGLMLSGGMPGNVKLMLTFGVLGGLQCSPLLKYVEVGCRAIRHKMP